MAVALMAKAKSKDSGKDESDETTMRIDRPALHTLNKLAAMRGLRKVSDLFDERDVQDFFNHLLLSEVRKEEQRLQGKVQR